MWCRLHCLPSSDIVTLLSIINILNTMHMPAVFPWLIYHCSFYSDWFYSTAVLIRMDTTKPIYQRFITLARYQIGHDFIVYPDTLLKHIHTMRHNNCNTNKHKLSWQVMIVSSYTVSFFWTSVIKFLLIPNMLKILLNVKR